MGICNILGGMMFLLQVNRNQIEFPDLELVAANFVIAVCFVNGILLITNSVL